MSRARGYQGRETATESDQVCQHVRVSDTPPTDLVVVVEPGVTIHMYEPVGPAMCSRCGKRSDDVCLDLLEGERETLSVGLCGRCLRDAMRSLSSA